MTAYQTPCSALDFSLGILSGRSVHIPLQRDPLIHVYIYIVLHYMLSHNLTSLLLLNSGYFLPVSITYRTRTK